jgi:hypothetical protein
MLRDPDNQTTKALAVLRAKQAYTAIRVPPGRYYGCDDFKARGGRDNLAASAGAISATSSVHEVIAERPIGSSFMNGSRSAPGLPSRPCVAAPSSHSSPGSWCKPDCVDYRGEAS